MRSLTKWLSAGLISGMLMNSGAFAADVIRVRLDWSPWGNQAPFHLAQKLGTFAKYNLDVKLDDGNGSVATVQIVGNGEYDVGHASLASMAIARSKGLPVRAFAGFVRRNDIGLIVDKESGVKKPGDLKGKKLAFTAGSLETPFLDRFLAAGNLKRSDVELISVDAAAKAGTYIAGRADGAFSSVPFILAVANQQRPSSSIDFADYGLTFPSFGLFATEQKMTEKSDAFRRLASVLAGTWTYILAGHEDEGVQAIIDARPQSKLNAGVLRTQIDTLKGFIYTPATRNEPIGFQAASDWAEAIKTLSDGGLIAGSPDPAPFFTNDLIDRKIVEEVSRGGK